MSTSDLTRESSAAGPPRAENDHGHSHLGLALVVIAMAQLMVVLDASIVNVALPHIQSALNFSQANLAWVINGYTLAFGGLLLLGGRAGDLFGRRRVFIAGILIFTVASLLGGFATSEAWLLSARVLQGAGAAIASPTALSLITTTFPEGGPRNRAMAVYAAMSGAGAAVGLVAGGLLTEYLSWRYVLFVNVPIGLAVALAAPRVLAESESGDGTVDWTGAILGTLGITTIVYGITRAGDPSHGFGDTWVIASFVAGALLLAAFIAQEMRHPHPIMPLRLFRDRNRSGSYVVMLIVGSVIFSMFYFLTLFVQYILGYSAVRSGLAFLPFTVGIVVGAGSASALTQKLPPRIIAGVGLVMAAVGLFLYSQLTPSASYASDLLPAMLITAVGLGLTFVPFTLAAVSGTGRDDAGIASALLNTMQQVGGSLGLAILATIASSATDSRMKNAFGSFLQAGAALRKGAHAPDVLATVQRSASALTHGYTTSFLTGGFMLVAALLITLVTINAKKQAADVEADASPTHVG